MTHLERRERRKRVADRAQAGELIEEIVIDTGLHIQTVRDACRVEGVEYCTRGHTDKPAARVLKVIGMLLATRLSYKQIAYDNGITFQAVEDICKRATAAGIPIKKRKATP